MAFLRLAARGGGRRVLRFRDRTCDPFAEPERLSVAEAFATPCRGRPAGDDPGGRVDRMPRRWRAELDRIGVRRAADDTWSDMLSRVLSEKVEPNLGHGPGDDPGPLSGGRGGAGPRRCREDARVAERFEVYACGVELANGFGELTDPAEQRRRFEAEMDEKARVYGESYPLDEDFLAALALMPPASGIAMGFDRLVMLATGAPRIDDVMWTPVP